MASSKGFYNTDKTKSLTFLEFGSLDLSQGEKKIWDFRTDQEAYDFFMLARYMKDLMVFRKLSAEARSGELGTEQFAIYQKEVHTQDFYNSFSKLAALRVASRAREGLAKASYLELGSTLFGCIDAMEFLQVALGYFDQEYRKVDLQTNVDFYGIDISDLLNQTAKAIHSNCSIHTF